MAERTASVKEGNSNSGVDRRVAYTNGDYTVLGLDCPEGSLLMKDLGSGV